jgi:hypothetical protein
VVTLILTDVFRPLVQSLFRYQEVKGMRSVAARNFS